ncbi:sensor histidine kinase [Leptothoe spongobia]|uniref:GAF domain-containing protein n=1 Tax=Leptothoe spongobia TAU-MAC 1115 TaxID=1967444 RepID=A0A947GM36_9CYAN|nr:GAF domain-containing protein [Leptothoe spongobia]MBT9317743.1 GAF domain-containing protein [Leptothoe spongobia TAU-MAC 1115]
MTNLSLLHDGFWGNNLDLIWWTLPRFTPRDNASFIGRNQLRLSTDHNHEPPKVKNGFIILQSDTYNPSDPVDSFLGSQIIDNQAFNVGLGVDVESEAWFKHPIVPGSGAFLFSYEISDTNNDDQVKVMEQQHQNKLISALKEISFSVTGSFDLDHFLQRIVETSINLANASRGAIFLYDESCSKLVMRAEKNNAPELRFMAGYEVDSTKKNKEKIGLPVFAFIQNETLALNSVEQIKSHPAHLGKYTKYSNTECHSLLCIPLKNSNGKAIGVLKLENTLNQEVHLKFSEKTKTCLELIADVATEVIINFKGQVSKIGQSTDLILSNSLGSNSTENLTERLRKIAMSFKEISNAGGVSIRLIEGSRLVCKAAVDHNYQALEKKAYPLPSHVNEDIPMGLTPWIIKIGETINIKTNDKVIAHSQYKATYNTVFYPDGQDNGQTYVGVCDSMYANSNTIDDFCENAANTFINPASIALSKLYLEKSKEEAWRNFTAIMAHRIGTETAIISGGLNYLRKTLKSIIKPRNKSLWKYELEDLENSVENLKIAVRDYTELQKASVAKRQRIDLSKLLDQVKYKIEKLQYYPMDVPFKFWASAREWQDAFNIALLPAYVPEDNQIYRYEVDYVSVERRDIDDYLARSDLSGLSLIDTVNNSNCFNKDNSLGSFKVNCCGLRQYVKKHIDIFSRLAQSIGLFMTFLPCFSFGLQQVHLSVEAKIENITRYRWVKPLIDINFFLKRSYDSLAHCYQYL